MRTVPFDRFVTFVIENGELLMRKTGRSMEFLSVSIVNKSTRPDTWKVCEEFKNGFEVFINLFPLISQKPD